MKRIAILLVLIMCCVALCPGASAYSGILNMENNAVVNDTGGCAVTVTLTLSFQDAVPEPVFPLPGDATDITLNGQRVSAGASDGGKQVSLRPVTGGGAGDFTVTLHYLLPGAVAPGEEGLELKLPMLCGFAYPVKNYAFSVTLPGEVEKMPTFTSSYYQELIGSQMSLSVNGNTIMGSCPELKDHESLTMVLPVPDDMFPQTAVTARVMGVMDVAVLICAALALAYFLLAMRPRFIRREARATAPDGVSPGDLQLWLTGRGIDLSLLVVTWAQLGYVRIQVDDNGRVLIHKRMDMGNERSSFENRCFKNLFGKRRIIDGTGYHYAHLCRSLWSKTPQIRDVYRPGSGNPKILRILCTLAGALGGVNLASAFTPHSLGLKVFLAIAAGAASLAIQSGGAAVPHRHKLALYIGGGCGAVWLLLGLISGEVLPTILIILFQFLCGLAVAYGGKRTVLGHQAMEQIVSLRRHMRKAPTEELKRLLQGNDGYFYELAPYALAMDVDRRFAKRFGKLKLQECSYLIIGNRRQMTAQEWAQHLRATVQTLDAKAKRLPLERLTGR